MSLLNRTRGWTKKIKPEFRNEVKDDAEKCIEQECFTYINKRCIRTLMIPVEIKIGEGGYNPSPNKFI